MVDADSPVIEADRLARCYRDQEWWRRGELNSLCIHLILQQKLIRKIPAAPKKIPVPPRIEFSHLNQVAVRQQSAAMP